MKNATLRTVKTIFIATVLFTALVLTIKAPPVFSQATNGGEVVVSDTHTPVAASDIPVVSENESFESSGSASDCGYATRNDGPNLDVLQVAQMVGSDITWAPYGSC